MELTTAPPSRGWFRSHAGALSTLNTGLREPALEATCLHWTFPPLYQLLRGVYYPGRFLSPFKRCPGIKFYFGSILFCRLRNQGQQKEEKNGKNPNIVPGNCAE